VGNHILLLTLHNPAKQVGDRASVTAKEILELFLRQGPRFTPRLRTLDLDVRAIILDLELVEVLEIGTAENIAHLVLHELLVLSELINFGIELLQFIIKIAVLTHGTDKVTLIHPGYAFS
jgi:hypothetical protein